MAWKWHPILTPWSDRDCAGRGASARYRHLVSFLDKIADHLDDDNGETSSLQLLRPKRAARHEPGVSLFVTEADGPELAPRNLGSPFTFRYFAVPPDYPRKIKDDQ